MWRLAEDGGLRPLLESRLAEAYNLPRQILPPVYLQNAAVDVVRSRRDPRAPLDDRRRGSCAYVMDSFPDVDDWRELAAARAAGSRTATCPRGRTFAFDLDGVIATLVPDDDYARGRAVRAGDRPGQPPARRGQPHRHLHRAGQPDGPRLDGDSHATQLDGWGVRHHELRFGKPAADYYVDDRMISLATLASLDRARASRNASRKSA